MVGDYDLLVNPNARRSPLRTAHRIFKKHREDFQKAATALSPTEWKFLRLIGAGKFHLFALAHPDPLRALLADLTFEMRDTIPTDWLDGREAVDVLGSTRQSVDPLTANETKAVWTVLCVAQLRELPIQKIVEGNWWKPHQVFQKAA